MQVPGSFVEQGFLGQAPRASAPIEAAGGVHFSEVLNTKAEDGGVNVGAPFREEVELILEPSASHGARPAKSSEIP